MNVYDFDNTIYDGDSSIDFYIFCLKRHPSILALFPHQVWGAVLYRLGKITKVRFKEIFFVSCESWTALTRKCLYFGTPGKTVLRNGITHKKI